MNLSSLAGFVILSVDLASDWEFPQMRVASVEVVKEAMLETLPFLLVRKYLLDDLVSAKFRDDPFQT